MGISVKVWALIVQLLVSFSVQASNIKEYFEYLDLSWKSMISRTHLKEVQAIFYWIKMIYIAKSSDLICN